MLGVFRCKVNVLKSWFEFWGLGFRDWGFGAQGFVFKILV